MFGTLQSGRPSGGGLRLARGSGWSGNGLQFDGSNDADTNTAFDPPSQGTLSCWFRFTQAPTGSQRLLGNAGNWELRADATGRIYCDLSGDGVAATFYTDAGVATAGEWHHLAAVYNCDADTYSVYCDGQLVSNGSMPLTDQPAGILSFGTRTGSTQRFGGALDDVRVYSYELNASQIAELYGLIGRWKLDASAGTTATDSSLKALNGALTNGASAGQLGPYDGAGAYAVGLDGANDYVNCSSSSDYPISNTFSIGGWVRLNSYRDGAAILENGSVSSSCSLATTSSGQLRLMAKVNGSTHSLTSTEALPLDTWKHVVGTYDGFTFRIYIDGALVSSSNDLCTLSNPSGNLTLGVSLDGSDEYLDGYLHDIQLYNRAISQEEVAELYGLVAWWKLDETSGSIAYDSSGMGNDATLIGTPDWTDGRVDGGHRFYYLDGEDYFVAPAKTTLNSLELNDYSVMAWFKAGSVPPGTDSAFDSAYGIVRKPGWHIGLSYVHDQMFLMEHWLASGPTWSGVGTWSQTYNAGQFHHLAGSVSRVDGTVRIYVDGQLLETATFTPDEAGLGLGSSPWRIGISNPGGGSWGHPADGIIDDARLYNRAVGGDEVARVYESGTAQGLHIIKWVEAR